MTSCTRNDGKIVDNSFCSPATKTQSCVSLTATCTDFVSGDCINGNGSTQLGANATLAAATTACQNFMQTRGLTNGACAWDSSGKSTTFAPAGRMGTCSSAIKSGVCTAS